MISFNVNFVFIFGTPFYSEAFNSVKLNICYSLKICVV